MGKDREPANVEVEVIPANKQTALRVKAEVDSAVVTADEFARNREVFEEKMDKIIADLSEEDAADCNYAVPAGGRNPDGTPMMHTGPSVRLLELMWTTWGNIVASSYTSRVEQDFVYAIGRCRDLESNVSFEIEVPRSIRTKNGSRFPPHLIKTTALAAQSIAFREAVFHVIPKIYVKKYAAAAKARSVGSGKTLAERQANVLHTFGLVGVPAERIFAFLGIKSQDQITVEHLATLTDCKTTLRNEQMTPEEMFPPLPADEEKPGAKGAAARARGRKPNAKPKPDPPPQDPPEPAAEEPPKQHGTGGGHFDEIICSELGCENVTTDDNGKLYPEKEVWCGSAKRCPMVQGRNKKNPEASND